jgi:CreA protein
MKKAIIGGAVLGLALACLSTCARAEQVGEVSTAFKLLGPDHKIAIEVFDDPKVRGVACYLSRAKTGGIAGAVGIATDTSDASIACRAVGPLAIVSQLNQGEQVFTESRSILFKKLRVVRFYDQNRKVLVYLTYSDKLVDGSPKNSISVVPFR